jgi:mono/diheme cytochrome c family protein
VIGLIATACSGPADPVERVPAAPPTLAPPGFLEVDEVPPPPPLDSAGVRAGAALYQQHCASCHKADLSGEPGWMIPNDDGTYRPPPHDSTGHTWHHTDQLLLEIVRDGSSDPIAIMPTFAGILTDQEVLDILEFFRSRWGGEERAFQWETTWRSGQESG